MIRALPLLLLLAGCAALKPAERLDTMRLAPQFPASADAVRPGGIQVTPVAATGSVAERRYVYVLASDPLLLRQAATLFWEVPPPVTMGQALTDALRTRFGGMDSGPVIGRVSTRLLRFEEVTGGTSPQAVVAVETIYAPIPMRTATTGRYCRSTPIAGDSSGARAAAFQSSVIAVAQAMADDIAVDRLTLSEC